MLELILFPISLVWRTVRDLMTPAENLPSNHSRGATWAGLAIGVVLLGGLIVFALGAMIKSSRPDGRYGTINGVPISRADFDACGGRIPDGCPGGASGMINKYESIRRQNAQ